MKQSLLFLLVLFTIISCGDDDENQTTGIQFNFAFEVDGETLEYGKTYSINGDAVSFDVAQYYIGDLSLTLDDASIVNFDGQYLLATPNTSALSDVSSTMGKTITKIDFNVGVSPSENSQSEIDFTQRNTNDVLSAQDPTMHWNWNSGYKFLRVDGDVDTDADGTVDTGIAYHIGSDPFLRSLSYDTSISLDESDNEITFTLDLSTFFNNVDLSTEIDTHTGDNLELAERLVDNYNTAISVE